MKRTSIKIMLESMIQYYIKPNPISGLMYVLYWLYRPEEYYMNLSLAQYYYACDKAEKEALISILANYRRP
jgi:hypothetical protein